MAKDYSSLAALAKRLIEFYGRALTLTKDSATPTDASKPWRGTTGVTSTAPIGVVLDFNFKEVDGTKIRRGDKQAFIASSSTIEDLRYYDRLVDGTDEWNIINVNTLEPGSLRLLYQLHLRQ